MTREEQVQRHNKNVEEAFAASRRGEVINLTALMGGAEEILVDDLARKSDRGLPYSDCWRVSE